MDTLRTLMIGTLVGAPLVTCGLSWFDERLSRRALLNLARLAVVAALLSACGLTFAAQVRAGQPVEFSITTWLRLPGFDVLLGGRLDGLAFVQTLLASVVLWLVLSAWPKHVSLRWLMLAWFGVTLANLAVNLGQMFVGWTLSAWASSELARLCDDPNGQESKYRPVWLVQRVSDIALLAGIGLVWMHFNSPLEFTAWKPEEIHALRPELIESIALCVLVGVIGRCAQLPLTVWLETDAGFAAQAGRSMAKLSDEMVGVWNVPDGHHVSDRLKTDPSNRWHESTEDSVPPTVLAWWLCAAFLPVGIGLLFRFEPLFAVASHTRLLMVAVGAFTLLMCSANAAAQTNWTRVLSQFAVGQCGLVLIGMGIDASVGGVLGLFALIGQSILIAVLLSANPGVRRQESPLIVVCLSFLMGGLCGRQAVAHMVWEHVQTMLEIPVSASADSEHVVLGATQSRLLLLVVAFLCLSELLTGFALFRAWFLSRREPVASSVADLNRRQRIVLWLATLVVMFGGLWAGSDFESWAAWMSSSNQSAADADSASVRSNATGRAAALFTSGPLVPLSLAGVVLAWWMYSKPSSLPEKFATAMGPFARLSRNRFYWDDLFFLLCVHPATAIGKWLSRFDERVLGGEVRALRSRLAKSLGESAEPLVTGSAMIGPLTTWSSVAVLAWLLLWLRS